MQDRPETVAQDSGAASSRSWRETLSVYLELAKARLASMVILTATVGFVLGAGGWTEPLTLLWTVLGTGLSAFGANILNQLAEHDRDRRMHRTRHRPLPAGRVSRRQAARWGVGSCFAGVVILAVATNLLTAGLSLFTILLYLLVYTPLKPRTPLNTVVGAVVGAVPPMMGWAAATGRLDVGAWILGGILFVWQIPHFLALAWLYREDYARGGFRMLPAVDHPGALTSRLAFLYSLALLPVTAALAWTGVTGSGFLIASQLLGLGLVVVGFSFARGRADAAARRLFLASILYLPLLLVVMVVDINGHRASFGRGSAASAVAVTASASPESSAGAGLDL